MTELARQSNFCCTGCPVILFTDGSLETEHGSAVARIGGVCVSTEGTFVFGAEVPELLNVWREGGEKEHVIGYRPCRTLRSPRCHEHLDPFDHW
jgi:hypothetical protein